MRAAAAVSGWPGLRRRWKGLRRLHGCLVGAAMAVMGLPRKASRPWPLPLESLPLKQGVGIDLRKSRARRSSGAAGVLHARQAVDLAQQARELAVVLHPHLQVQALAAVAAAVAADRQHVRVLLRDQVGQVL